MTSFSKITHTPEFERDLKKLLKRYPSLTQDLHIFVSVQLVAFHKHNMDNNGIVPLAGLGLQSVKAFKARKFACKSMKGKGANSGIRVVYAYFEGENRIELIEIYYKGDQANESRERIKDHYHMMALV